MGGRVAGYLAYGSFILNDKIRPCGPVIPREWASIAVARPED
jgi:hypothetical protein